MIAGERSFRARTHIPQNEGPRAAVDLTPRRVPVRSRATADDEGVKARTAARSRRSGKVRLRCGAVTCAGRPIEETKKTRGRFRRGFSETDAKPFCKYRRANEKPA